MGSQKRFRGSAMIFPQLKQLWFEKKRRGERGSCGAGVEPTSASPPLPPPPLMRANDCIRRAPLGAQRPPPLGGHLPLHATGAVAAPLRRRCGAATAAPSTSISSPHSPRVPLHSRPRRAENLGNGSTQKTKRKIVNLC